MTFWLAYALGQFMLPLGIAKAQVELASHCASNMSSVIFQPPLEEKIRTFRQGAAMKPLAMRLP